MFGCVGSRRGCGGPLGVVRFWVLEGVGGRRESTMAYTGRLSSRARILEAWVSTYSRIEGVRYVLTHCSVVLLGSEEAMDEDDGIIERAIVLTVGTSGTQVRLCLKIDIVMLILKFLGMT